MTIPLSQAAQSASPEHRLLIACASSPRDRLEHTIGDLAPRVDWPEFLSVALAQQLTYLAFVRLESFAALVPHEVLGQLRNAYVVNSVRNKWLIAQLARVLQAFDEESIDSILLKGAALIGRIIEDPGTRFMSDVDLLVREQDIMRAWGLVRELGFQPAVDEAGRTRIGRGHHHYPRLVDSGAISHFEIHRTLTSDTAKGLQFDVAGLWNRAREVDISGCRTHVLAPDDFLAHLCIHFFLDRRKSSHQALSQLRDIRETVLHCQADLDWDRLIDESVKTRIAGPLFVSILVANAVLDVPVPDEVLTALRPADLDEDCVRELVLTRVLREGGWDRWSASGAGQRSADGSLLRRLRRWLPRAPRWWMDLRSRHIQRGTWTSRDLRTEQWVDELLRKEVHRSTETPQRPRRDQGDS